MRSRTHELEIALDDGETSDTIDVHRVLDTPEGECLGATFHANEDTSLLACWTSGAGSTTCSSLYLIDDALSEDSAALLSCTLLDITINGVSSAHPAVVERR